MTTLHTVNKSPLQSALLEDCLEFAAPAAGIVFLEDGVLALLDSPVNRDLLDEAGQTLYALHEDVRARGLEERLLEGVTLVDYGAFVALCCRYDKVVNWS